MQTFDFIVIGGGIVGAATAYQYAQRNPLARIAVLEKESAPAAHQTGRNSGVIHSGLYYKPGSLKAKTCLSGYTQLLEFCQAHDVAHEVCGKIVVATDEAESARLDVLFNRGLENGLEGLALLDPRETRGIEPHISACRSLWVPQTGMVDYPGMTQAMLLLAMRAGGSLRLQTTVARLARRHGVTTVHTIGGESYQAPQVVVCAGLQSDRLAHADGVKSGMRIIPFRGDYYDLTPQAAYKVRNLVYPVPDPAFPFLGVHFTRMVDGGVECGPNAVFSFAREGYRRTSFDAADTASALGFAGTWKLFASHWRYGLGEYQRAFSKRKFLTALQKMMPDLQIHDIVPGRAGIRAQALDDKGHLVDDFVMETGESAIHVLNAPSPAATASLAIAQEILERIEKI